ncbi:MAG: hypothetical protein K9J27_01720 [Bacteroidales bacterium]|nr:hypothetical protein [Bacteroidales bacterium]
MDEVIKYIETVLGEKLFTKNIHKDQYKNLPFYVTNTFALREGELLGQSLIFAIQKTRKHYTPEQYKNILGQIGKKLDKPVILILDEIETYKRKRLIEKRVNFIITNKQLFLPSLLVDLKEYLSEPDTKGRLRPVAQLLVLYHILKEELNDMTFIDLAKKFNYSYISISRAADNLKRHQVCDIRGRKNKKFFFGNNNNELWEKALPYFKYPILKKAFIESSIPVNTYYKSYFEALAYYTDINGNQQQIIAISKSTYNNIKAINEVGIHNGTEEDYNLEVWRYDPGILANNGFVDPLSLYLIFRDNEDERIQMALDKILKTYIW